VPRKRITIPASQLLVGDEVASPISPLLALVLSVRRESRVFPAGGIRLEVRDGTGRNGAYYVRNGDTVTVVRDEHRDMSHEVVASARDGGEA
jgi:hypothetical protein